jgi:hypothetical protein
MNKNKGIISRNEGLYYGLIKKMPENYEVVVDG